MNTDPITDFIQNTERRDETHEKNPTTNQTRLFGGGRVLGDSLGALRDGVLGKLTRQDQSNATDPLVTRVEIVKCKEHTRSGSRVMRWWTSCCRQQAWMPRWRRARRCR